MVTSRALVERTSKSMQLIEHDPGESPRSIQLYGVDPATVGAAVRLLLSEDRADHIDLNFGCPVPKVTRKGGGAALPWKTDLFRAIVSSAVREATAYDVPVTIKMRKGIDPDHLTFLEAGRIAEGEGVAAVALHARTASQGYSGQADWAAIKALKEAVTSIPVLGNGDIWSAQDALDMVAATGCPSVSTSSGRSVRARHQRASCTARCWSACGPPALPANRTTSPTARAGAARTICRAARVPRHPQARGVVPQRVPGRPRHPAATCPG